MFPVTKNNSNHPAREARAKVKTMDELAERFPGSSICSRTAASSTRDQCSSTSGRRLPGSHLPRVFTALDAIPRTGSGKVKRAELRRLARETA